MSNNAASPPTVPKQQLNFSSWVHHHFYDEATNVAVAEQFSKEEQQAQEARVREGPAATASPLSLAFRQQQLIRYQRTHYKKIGIFGEPGMAAGAALLGDAPSSITSRCRKEYQRNLHAANNQHSPDSTDRTISMLNRIYQSKEWNTTVHRSVHGSSAPLGAHNDNNSTEKSFQQKQQQQQLESTSTHYCDALSRWVVGRNNDLLLLNTLGEADSPHKSRTESKKQPSFMTDDADSDHDESRKNKHATAESAGSASFHGFIPDTLPPAIGPHAAEEDDDDAESEEDLALDHGCGDVYDILDRDPQTGENCINVVEEQHEWVYFPPQSPLPPTHSPHITTLYPHPPVQRGPLLIIVRKTVQKNRSTVIEVKSSTRRARLHTVSPHPFLRPIRQQHLQAPWQQGRVNRVICREIR